MAHPGMRLDQHPPPNLFCELAIDERPFWHSATLRRHGKQSDTLDVVSEPITERVKPLIRTRQIRLFTTDPVADEQLRALAAVARWSGSSRNSQPWRFIVVRDVPLIRRIADVGHPQTRSLHTAMAALAITLPVDEGREISLAYDDGRVAERVLIGASMLGLGAAIAWVRSDVRQDISGLLGVEEGRFVRTIMAIGHPSPEGLAPKSAPGQARLPVEELVTWRP